MKYRCEVLPELSCNEEEIVIRCRAMTEKIRLIEGVLENLLVQGSELILYIRDTEYYIPKQDILYFETEDGKVRAHTADRIFTADYKLFELEQIMPSNFVRASKSCILNTARVEAISRNLTGASEVFFKGCRKKVYVSRGYYKLLKEKIKETRFFV